MSSGLLVSTTPQHVFTSTAPDTSLANTVLVDELLVDYVAPLKEGTGGG